MGHRANMILVLDDGYELYYSHWRANSLPRDVFWGPLDAMAFIRSQRPCSTPESGWLDDVWAEGGVLVDPAAKVLILFGGEELSFEIPLRRCYLNLLRKVWQHWDVRWAHEGIANLADYVGYPREKVLTRSPPERRETSLASPSLATGSTRS